MEGRFPRVAAVAGRDCSRRRGRIIGGSARCGGANGDFTHARLQPTGDRDKLHSAFLLHRSRDGSRAFRTHRTAVGRGRGEAAARAGGRRTSAPTARLGQPPHPRGARDLHALARHPAKNCGGCTAHPAGCLSPRPRAAPQDRRRKPRRPGAPRRGAHHVCVPIEASGLARHLPAAGGQGGIGSASGCAQQGLPRRRQRRPLRRGRGRGGRSGCEAHPAAHFATTGEGRNHRGDATRCHPPPHLLTIALQCLCPCPRRSQEQRKGGRPPCALPDERAAGPLPAANLAQLASPSAVLLDQPASASSHHHARGRRIRSVRDALGRQGLGQGLGAGAGGRSARRGAPTQRSWPAAAPPLRQHLGLAGLALALEVAHPQRAPAHAGQQRWQAAARAKEFGR
mmetsp:Transcript_26296/g.66746  ORF Transcript_26296/g.66746 Transcript_26296/m.66746 type:complete len:397 (-) Transcript_26296:149-1339(-)